MAAANRTLSPAKIKAIEDSISSKRRELARQDPDGWAAKSKDQQVAEAAQAAMKDIEGEAARTEYLGTLQLLKTDETGQRIAAAKTMSAMKLTQSQAQIRDIQNANDYVHTVRDEAVSGLGAMLDAASSKDGTGILRNLAMRIWDLDNPQMTVDVVREVSEMPTAIPATRRRRQGRGHGWTPSSKCACASMRRVAMSASWPTATFRRCTMP